MDCRNVRSDASDESAQKGKVEVAHEIVVLGDQIVDGRRLQSTRTLEFVLALALGGGERRRSSLMSCLFSDCASKSAIPTLAYRARQVGINTEFNTIRASYRLTSIVSIDAVNVLNALRTGDVSAALSLYGGPCLGSSDSPLATEVRERIDRLLLDAALNCRDDSVRDEAVRKLDKHWFGFPEQGQMITVEARR